MSKMGLIWRTVRHLKPRQVVGQLVRRLRGRARLRLPVTAPTGQFVAVPDADKPVSWQNDTFTFLNQPVRFPSSEKQDSDQPVGESGTVGCLQTVEIDWNHARNGKLWTYHLNYFDFLNQPGMTAETGLALVQNFVGQTGISKDGLEPYPTAIRIGNWVQFLSRHCLRDDAVNAHLFAQVALLRRRLEYHLMGNHLLENGLALLMGALFFRHQTWFRTAAALVRTELETQILADGGHDERSPMYHQLLLDRLLDVLIALRADTWHIDSAFSDFLNQKATHMLTWLGAVTFANGDVPMVNDAAWHSAPTTAQLRAKAARLGMSATFSAGSQSTDSLPHRPLTASGYRMLRPGPPGSHRYELFADVGPVGPDHQPGHAHADTFSFILYVNKQPVIVDSGTSTYQTGPRRAWERSTAAHNTVVVNGQNSSEVWNGFRVGQRARVRLVEDGRTRLRAQHDGYRPFGITHERTWSLRPAELLIRDRLLGQDGQAGSALSGVARFYFHPDVWVTLDDGASAGPVRLSFASTHPLSVCVTAYEMANGFNQRQPGQCVEVTFMDELNTRIILTTSVFSQGTIP